MEFLAYCSGVRCKLMKMPLMKVALNPFVDLSREELNELRRVLESKEVSLKNAAQRINELTTNIQGLQAEIKVLRDKVAQYEENISVLEEDLKNEKGKCANLQSQLEEEVARRKETEYVVANLSEEIARLKADLEMTRLLLSVISIMSVVFIAVYIVIFRRPSL